MGLLPFPPAADLLHTCDLDSCLSSWHLPFFHRQWATAVAQHKAWWVIFVVQHLPCTLLCIKCFVLGFCSWQCFFASCFSTYMLNMSGVSTWLLLYHPHPVEACFKTCSWMLAILSHLLKQDAKKHFLFLCPNSSSKAEPRIVLN